MALENGEQKDKEELDLWRAAILLQAREIEKNSKSGESEQ